MRIGSFAPSCLVALLAAVVIALTPAPGLAQDSGDAGPDIWLDGAPWGQFPAGPWTDDFSGFAPIDEDGISFSPPPLAPPPLIPGAPAGFAGSLTRTVTLNLAENGPSVAQVAVPEPTTAVLTALGTIALIAARRRARSSSRSA